MKPRLLRLVCAVFCASGVMVMAGLSPDQLSQLPPAASHPVSFSRDIQPILEASCIKCHGRGRDRGEFAIDSRETVLKGGESGPAVVVGNSAESLLIELVMGFDPDMVMPQKGTRLTMEQIGLLRAWIDQGLKWDDEITFARKEPMNLIPRRPELPAIRGRSANPIDRLLEPYFTKHNTKRPALVDDRTFARRAYLDVIGLLPQPDELEAFVAEQRRDKRAQLVRRLLADNRSYAVHWMTFWNDALRNDYRGTGYIDGGRKQITQWLYAALENNLPYDQFVAQLVNPKPESEGFVKGIVWRGVVNASQTPQMQAAQNVSQVFMGVNLKCASCHDSFIDDWRLSDAYGLAGIYSDEPLEMVLCDKPTGQTAELKFIYPQLGSIDPAAPKAQRLEQLAALITQRQDGRLTRTMVNRLWRVFMGHGLVEPVDEMESPAWHPDLLDWLAEDFADHRYDLKHVIERILTSEAYQMPAVAGAEQERAEYVFRGPLVRRLSAEQFRDAVFTLTGVGEALPASGPDFVNAYFASVPPRSKPPEFPSNPQWIWKDAQAARSAKPETIYLRKVINLEKAPTEAVAIAACDDSFSLFVNGTRVGARRGTKPELLDIAAHLKPGANVIAISAVNDEPPKEKKASTNANETVEVESEPKPTPAGFLMYARVRAVQIHGGIPVETVMDFWSDASWLWTDKRQDKWETPEFDATNWNAAAELGGPGLAPWNIAKPFRAAELAVEQFGNYRASLANASSLQAGLGRPNREQVVTTRTSIATTLQALELTNGPELAELLGRGAERTLALGQFASNRELVHQLFQTALGRNPTSAELQTAAELLGQPARKEGLEDLLWSLAMLPEFQLIY